MTNTPFYDPCAICKTQSAESFPSNFDGIHQKCPRCGDFRVSGSALATMEHNLSVEQRAKVSGWVHDQNTSGDTPLITTHSLMSIVQRPLPGILERSMGLLIEAERGLLNLGDRFDINEQRFLSATYSSKFRDVQFLLHILTEQGLAQAATMDGKCEILPQGYIKLDELRGKRTSSSQGFVAMWFNEELDTAYSDGLQAGIMLAGYDPIRIDHMEHVNKIDDEIIKQIKASKFAVADFTGHRGGVYFEAGFALGIEIPVFWTCREDCMDDLHFDIRQFNCISWKSPSDLKVRLAARIEAVLGAGPRKPTS